ncbi:putative N-octanoylanthranilate hydrolase AqdA1 [Qipengyuania sp. 483]
MWVIGIVVALVLLAALGLWIAVQRNGPAVLDTVDRIAGGSSGVELVQIASTGPSPQQQVRVFRPDEAGEEPLPVLVFIHGGSWASGDPADYGFVARNIAAQGYVVVLAGYRLGEGGRYPGMLEDTAADIGWVYRNIARYGGDPERLVISGHSAGAYNAVQAVLDPQWLAAAGVPRDAIRGVIGLSGPYDFYPFDTDSTRAAFGSAGAGPDSQPVNTVTPGAPPMLLIHGEADTTVKPRNSQALAAALRAQGDSVETLYLPGKNHADPLLMLASPWRRDARVFDAMMQFMDSTVRTSVPVQPKTP